MAAEVFMAEASMAAAAFMAEASVAAAWPSMVAASGWAASEAAVS